MHLLKKAQKDPRKISIIASFMTYDQAGANEREIDLGNTIKLLSALLFKKQSSILDPVRTQSQQFTVHSVDDIFSPKLGFPRSIVVEILWRIAFCLGQ